MNFENVFVTVGTTKFDKLIQSICSPEIIQVLEAKNCKNLTIQLGVGKFIPEIENSNISLQYYRYKDSLLEDMLKADLIISHAGAGTCLEVLELHKPLVTVINDLLMDNHQTELAEKLNEKGHSFCCTCDSLVDVVNNSEFNKLKSFIYDNDQKCALFIDNLFSNKIN